MTAVEWLIDEFRKNRITVPMQMEQQAKEIEKEQICNSYSQALIDLTLYEDGEISDEEYLVSKERAEQYYKKTFKSE